MMIISNASRPVSPAAPPAAGAGPVAARRRRASLYVSGVWIRQPQELHMKRLLGLLLVMGMVGCGCAKTVEVAEPWEVLPRSPEAN